MRKRSGKSARLREKHLTEKDVVMEEIEGIGEEVQEEVVTDAPVETAEAPGAEGVANTAEDVVDAPKDDEKAPSAESDAKVEAEEPAPDAEGEKAEDEAPAAEEAEKPEESGEDEDKQ